MIEYKSFKLEGKSDDGSTIFGHCSVKNVIDLFGDVVVDGAYTNLSETIRTGFTCINHKHSDLPVGYITKLEEDSVGLYFEAKFHSTKEGQDAYTVVRERMEAGIDTGLSIGFRTLKYTPGVFMDSPVRFLQEIFVKEIAITLLPANEGAGVMGMKSRTQEFSDIVTSIQAYTQRLLEIKSLGRGQSFAEKSAGELEELTTLISELKEVRESLVPELGEPGTTEALGAEVELKNLELAKAEAEAILAMLG